MLVLKTNSTILFQKYKKCSTLIIPIRYPEPKGEFLPTDTRLCKMTDKKVIFRFPKSFKKITLKFEKYFPDKTVGIKLCDNIDRNKIISTSILKFFSFNIVQYCDVPINFLGSNTVKVSPKHIHPDTWVYVLQK